MNLKKKYIYFYYIQKQLLIPINRHEYNLRCNAIDFFEIKKQYINTNYIDNLFFNVLKKKIIKFNLEYFNIFRLLLIDGVYIYNNKYYTNTFIKLFYLNHFATKIDSYYVKSFTKIKSILYQNVFYLYIPAGVFIKYYIEILYISTVIKNKMFNIKHFIFIDKGSCLRIFERYKNLTKKNIHLISNIEIFQKANSYLSLVKIKDDFLTSFLDHTFLLQEDRSECLINSFSFYGKSIINYLYVFQIGKEIHSYIDTFNICNEYMNHNSLIEHTFPNGKSRDINKNISNNMANIIYNNKIIILKSAIKTNASQNNKNILFINPMSISTNPKLEIFANNVKCYHGCIIGNLIPIEIFYLQSRGFPKKEAMNKLLIAKAINNLESIFCKEIKILINEKINLNINVIIS